MNALSNTLNSTLQALSQRASVHVTNAIQKASQTTGVDFTYLMQQAAAESNFTPDAKAKTSSATGLYQFIEKTWLSMMERYGDQYGVDTQSMSKKEILNLRKDPNIASFMAAEFASENRKFLDHHWGGDVGATELYFAHFLGAGKAASFLNAYDKQPLHAAADLFPKAAKANYNVFYDRATGRARTIGEVYAFFDKKFEVTSEKESKSAMKYGSETDEVVDVKRVQELQAKARPSPRMSLYAAAQNQTAYSILNPIPKSLSGLVNPFEVLFLSQIDLPLFSNTQDTQEENRPKS